MTPTGSLAVGFVAGPRAATGRASPCSTRRRDGTHGCHERDAKGVGVKDRRAAASFVPPMTRTELLHRFARIRTATRKGESAPHKPLLLLLALGRVAQGRGRLVAFASVEPILCRMSDELGPRRRAFDPVYPFGRLRRDGLWEIPGDAALSTTSSGNLHARELRERGVVGGFPQDVHDLLASDPELVVEAAELLLGHHFDSERHDALRAAAGLRWDWALVESQPRGAHENAFRDLVLGEYQDRCSVCDFDARMDDRAFAVEAARIRWRSHGGPTDVSNALALCLLHHKALNHGVLGLRPERSGYRVVISNRVLGSSPATEQLRDLHGRPVRRPLTAELAPSPSCVEWHRRWVFRAPPRRDAAARN